MYFLLTALSALFALGAAILWLLSTVVRTPDKFSVHVSRPEGFMGEPLGGGPLHAASIGTAHSSDFKQLADALKRQSRLPGSTKAQSRVHKNRDNFGIAYLSSE